jgi:Zn-dependent protease
LEFLLTLPVILISLSVHEWMHGYAAYRLGDSTAKYMGRLSLNPLHHIDPIGFIALAFFHVGWAKPVVVDARNFKNPKRDMALCAMAGPASNFILAFLSSFLYVFLGRIGMQFGLFSDGATPYYFLFQMAGLMITINLGLGVFNLIPIPPLDGSKVLYAFLPYKIIFKIAPYEKYIQLVMLLLLWLGVLSPVIGSAVSFFYRLFVNLAQGVIL